jgi:hypothetical protein
LQVLSGINGDVSIVHPSLRPHRKRFLIGLLAAIAILILVPVASSAQARHHLVFQLTGPSHQNMVDAEGVTIALHCPTEACTVVASATSVSPAVHSASVRTRVAAGTTKQLTLPLAPRQTNKLKAALKSGKSPILTVHATARDASGNRVPLTLQVRSTHG